MEPPIDPGAAERDAVVRGWGPPPDAPPATPPTPTRTVHEPSSHGPTHAAAGARRTVLVVAIGGTLGLVGGMAIAGARTTPTVSTDTNTDGTNVPATGQDPSSQNGSNIDPGGQLTPPDITGAQPGDPGTSGAPDSSSHGS